MAITFDTIANGELAEKFQMALTQIGRNIMDPNTDPEAVRGMTVNIKFKPAGRGNLKVDFSVSTKLAGFKKSETVFLVGQDGRTGRISMSEPGSGLPQVTSIRETPAAAYTDVRQEPEFDSETGEIFEEPVQAGPIDLRQAYGR